MSVHVKCDRCGAQEKTSDAMLFAGLTGPSIPTARPELPDGWTRPTLPAEDGSAWKRELCPACKADLFRFMAGQPVIDDSDLASQLMRIASPGCPTCGPGVPLEQHPRLPVQRCSNCKEHMGVRNTREDLGTGARPDQICPDCGHLRHSSSCPDQVPEKGPCGCDLRTTPQRMKELGIDD